MAFPWPTDDDKPRVQLRTEAARQALEQAQQKYRPAAVEVVPSYSAFLGTPTADAGGGLQSPAAPASPELALEVEKLVAWSPGPGRRPQLSPAGFRAVQKHKLESENKGYGQLDDGDYGLRPNLWCAVGPTQHVEEGRRQHPEGVSSPSRRMDWSPAKAGRARRLAELDARVQQLTKANPQLPADVPEHTWQPESTTKTPLLRGEPREATKKLAGRTGASEDAYGLAEGPPPRSTPRKSWVPGSL
eukprot:TRINITY_DN34823_c0_g1_i1.p1 TRINITY_DN34823_c0_g1~~TRINITY_DN34823_c0_g1_i1.p1  ORF type:complete len:245 (+),score=44.31 TRINITY_DN34823_c0_g1_i1:97-831(+)